MRVDEIATLLQGKIVCGAPQSELALSYGFAADLLSDVLTLDHDGILLVTGLCTPQTIRTAEMAEIDCVVIARGKQAGREMLELAQSAGVVLIESNRSVFQVSGLLFNAGLRPVY